MAGIRTLFPPMRQDRYVEVGERYLPLGAARWVGYNTPYGNTA